ncbi:MAG: site-2 protease family protein [bacterium]|nr:site-2 protease family protein [bacterium]
MIAIIFLILIFSLTIHEIAHGLVALWLGDDTAKVEGRITLNPIAHFDYSLSIFLPLLCIIFGTPIIGGAKPVPVNPRKIKGGDWGMALVALAGPMSNLLMAFGAFAVLSIFNLNAGLLATSVVYFIRINLGLMLFNLLPIPPLDGSKIIYPIAPEFIQRFILRASSNPTIVFFAILIFSSQIANLIGIVQSWILTVFYSIF